MTESKRRKFGTQVRIKAFREQAICELLVQINILVGSVSLPISPVIISPVLQCTCNSHISEFPPWGPWSVIWDSYGHEVQVDIIGTAPTKEINEANEYPILREVVDEALRPLVPCSLSCVQKGTPWNVTANYNSWKNNNFNCITWEN